MTKRHFMPSFTAAASVMRAGRIHLVLVGADRIAANGDVANKIGTYQLAVNAMHHGVRFMVVAPSSTIDMALDSGESIPIEERDGREVTRVGPTRLAPAGAMVAHDSPAAQPIGARAGRLPRARIHPRTRAPAHRAVPR